MLYVCCMCNFQHALQSFSSFCLHNQYFYFTFNFTLLIEVHFIDNMYILHKHFIVLIVLAYDSSVVFSQKQGLL